MLLCTLQREFLCIVQEKKKKQFDKTTSVDSLFTTRVFNNKDKHLSFRLMSHRVHTNRTDDDCISFFLFQTFQIKRKKYIALSFSPLFNKQTLAIIILIRTVFESTFPFLKCSLYFSLFINTKLIVNCY